VLADRLGRLLTGVTAAEPTTTFADAARFMEHATGRSAYRVPLAGGRFPHIDMSVSDPNGKAWLVYPLQGFDLHDPAWRALFAGRPVIQANVSNADQLACNLVVRGDLVKAGGSTHCLTLELPAIG